MPTHSSTDCGKVSDNEVVQVIARQLEHCDWAGFRFEDLIFPMFVFIVGVSLVFSLSRTIEQQGVKRRSCGLSGVRC